MKSVFKPFFLSVLFLALTASGCNNAQDDVVDVTITGGAESVHKGAFTLFTGKNVTWTIVESDKHPNTAIDGAGLLFIAQGETKKTLTVQATSLSNPAVSATASVAIPAATARVDMGAQPIYPLQGHADMLPGDYRLLTAYNLVDPYETDIEWKWEIIGAVSDGTRISTDSVGWFDDPENDEESEKETEVIAVTSATIEISGNERMGSVFMLKATHPYDPDIFGYATVSVRRPSVTQVILETEQERAAPGETFTVMVLVIGTGTIPEEDGNVLLSISGNTSPDTQISLYGGWGGAELTVAADETAQSITVTAISEKNPNVSGDITIDL